MKIRAYKPEDFTEVKNLHLQTVQTINAQDYSQEQINTWPKLRAEDLENNTCIVAEKNNTIIGFADMSKETIHRIYTHKNHQKTRIGTKLLKKLEETAKKQEITELKLISSTTAKTFYEKHGYTTTKQVSTTIQGIKHEDYEMKKHLTSFIK